MENKKDLYFVYLIGKDIETGYIGVSKNPQKRYNSHCSSKYPVGKYIRDNKLELLVDINLKILFGGTMEECFREEIRLRPFSNMGLNVSSGGNGGDKIKCLTPKQLLERNRKISIGLKGIVRSEEYKKKISDTKVKLKLHHGKSNGRAIKWKFVSPDNKEYIIEGESFKFCDMHNISCRLLRNHLGKKVPAIRTGTAGGFRPKNKEHLEKRNNTVGWTLFKLEK